MTRRWFIAAALLVLSCAGVGSIAAQEPKTIDPQSLIGEWWGDMVGDAYSWKTYLTLKSVQDAGKLAGSVYVVVPTTGTGTAYGNRDNPVTATLDGDRLSFAVMNGPEYTVTVSGKTMTGTYRGIRISGPVSFTKVK
jgi:hypothetical protein